MFTVAFYTYNPSSNLNPVNNNQGIGFDTKDEAWGCS